MTDLYESGRQAGIAYALSIVRASLKTSLEVGEDAAASFLTNVVEVLEKHQHVSPIPAATDRLTRLEVAYAELLMELQSRGMSDMIGSLITFSPEAKAIFDARPRR